MFAKGACRTIAWQCEAAGQGSLLPFLYCTKTIQQRPYNTVSRGTRSSRDDRSGDGDHDEGRKFRQDTDTPLESRARQWDRVEKGRHTDWRKLDLTGNDRGDEAERTPRHDRRRNEYSSRSSDHVPFETPEDTQAADLDLDGSTITPREREAFEKLFKMKKGTESTSEKTDVAKKRKPERELGLDAILDAAVQNIKPRERPPPQFPAALRPMAEEARERQRTTRPATAETYKDQAIQEDLDRITALMDKAGTDVDLWNILNTHLLNRVAALGLDPATTSKQKAAVKAWHEIETSLRRAAKQNPAKSPSRRAPVSDLTILTANLSTHLQHFMTLMPSTFPSSLLALNLLPTLKSLGPSAFALGASSSLYNAHMRALYTAYGPSALHTIADTLREMDREVYDFDEETLALLLRIIKDAKKYRRGNGGPGLFALWNTESTGRGVKGMLQWRVIVEEKRQEGALRRAREEEAMREAETEEGGGEGIGEERGGVAIAAG